MKTFRVRMLENTDTEALLAFETHNREWFESHIDARDPSFYSLQGVAAHIESYLSGFAIGTWHPFVIEDASEGIVGRANLKNINSPTGSAEVGYRIDQRFCGQGLATLALKHLIQEAQMHWNLTQLLAHVYKDNIGSRKVLNRCGFLVEHKSWIDKTKDECQFILSI
ncbi:GNAT family N-acetyltransferase [Pseudomonas sp. 6D_7.1_Bac1]|uniref:GNAT family N-acetyltransferase n=1 Tax=Pseudomonas sp. 6D_7.1_Bac1 TaxID=2971615 RepID=UPI0021C936BC|nr:GNAT family N-acetyltransferase [Pseudomonas sp. 6D_7.1_Bac1]MCU1750357.1 GNAT family N-acetyltransferase [Pseudomonas sp. 6D_7.1_Bac1]